MTGPIFVMSVEPMCRKRLLLKKTKSVKNISKETDEKVEQSKSVPSQVKDKDDYSSANAAHTIEPKDKKQKISRKRIIVFTGAGLLALIILFLITGFIVIQSKYSKAGKLLESGSYTNAYNAYQSIRWYRDSEEKSLTSSYEQAKSFMNSEKYEAALQKFNELGTFKDSEQFAKTCQKYLDYNDAVLIMRRGGYLQAKEIFDRLGNFLDSRAYANECQNESDYKTCVSLIDQGDYQKALDNLIELGKYKDSVEMAVYCQNMLNYQEAVSLMDSGDYQAALDMFEILRDFEDSENKIAVCSDYVTYSMAEEELTNGNNFDAYMLFGSISYFSDAEQRQAECILETPSASVLSRNPDYSSKSCSVTIKGPSADYMLHTYIKVYSETDDLVLTLFIPSGEKLKVGLPSGTYTFKTGYGWDWFGEQNAFGPMGEYSILLFDGGVDSWKLSSSYIYTLTLMIDGDGGNVGSEIENFNDF